MRALIEGLESPHPLGAALPALFQDDEFTQRFTASFDEVLAPIFCTLDNLEAYFDPFLAPSDFVAWLAGWVGLSVDENWPVERQRALIAKAAELYSWRGTRKGLKDHIALYAGVEPEVVDTGGCEWSTTSGGALPGTVELRVTIRLRVPEPSSVDPRRVDAIVAAAKPAHVRHDIEVLQS
jgi:phage tail-like protein